MLKIKPLLSLWLIAIFSQPLYADDAMTSALQQTQDCLKNQSCESAKTMAGQAADQKALEAVLGNIGDKQELYNISADIMPILLQQTGGDPEKMQALLLNAQNNPAVFLNSLPANIQNRIKNVAGHVEKNKANAR